MAIALRLVEDAQGTHQRGDVMLDHHRLCIPLYRIPGPEPTTEKKSDPAVQQCVCVCGLEAKRKARGEKAKCTPQPHGGLRSMINMTANVVTQ